LHRRHMGMVEWFVGDGPQRIGVDFHSKGGERW
jgi:hypothetical protein